MTRSAAVIGSGFGGLALAIRLQSAGIATTIIEARDKPGGRAYYWNKGGHVFDAGPTVITDPACLRELWELTGADMARDVDTLMVIVPGGPSTQNMIDAEVLRALGPRGVVINMARGSVIDEPALIEALKNRTIYSAGLDVFANEPHVPKELIEMDHVVLFPHLGSSTEVTRAAMDQLVVDNILAWASGKPPLTPVAETPYPPKRG